MELHEAVRCPTAKREPNEGEPLLNLNKNIRCNELGYLHRSRDAR